MSIEVIKLTDSDPDIYKRIKEQLICECGCNEFEVFRSITEIVLACIDCGKKYPLSTE